MGVSPPQEHHTLETDADHRGGTADDLMRKRHEYSVGESGGTESKLDLTSSEDDELKAIEKIEESAEESAAAAVAGTESIAAQATETAATQGNTALQQCELKLPGLRLLPSAPNFLPTLSSPFPHRT